MSPPDLLVLLAGAGLLSCLPLLLIWGAGRFRRAGAPLRWLIARLNGFQRRGDFPPTTRPDGTGCGAACAELVAREVLGNAALDGAGMLRRTAGTSMLDLHQAFQQVGLSSRGVRLRSVAELQGCLREWRAALLPLDLSFYFGGGRGPWSAWWWLYSKLLGARQARRVRHWVVLDPPTDGGGLDVRDPALGWLRVPPARLERAWDGAALLVGAVRAEGDVHDRSA